MSDTQQPYVIGGGMSLNQQYPKPQETAAGTSPAPPAQQQQSVFAAPLTPPDSDPQSADVLNGQSPANRQLSSHNSETPRSTYPPPVPNSAPEQNYPSTPSKGFSSQPQADQNHGSPHTASSDRRGTQNYPAPSLPPRQQIEPPAAGVPSRYTRDPHRLTAYLVPLPKPQVGGTYQTRIPDRFLIYIPLKMSTADIADRRGVSKKARRGFKKAVGLASTSTLDFLNRVPSSNDTSSRQSSKNSQYKVEGDHQEDYLHEGPGLQEFVLFYPASYNVTPEHIKAEFIYSLMRTKSIAQRNDLIATMLLPAVMIIHLFTMPNFGALDRVWLYTSAQGAKAARSITKRLPPSTEDQEVQHVKLDLKLEQDPRVDTLYKYLCSKCAARDRWLFPSEGMAPSESEVLDAIGWAPSQTEGERNREDEQWERNEVQDDLRRVMRKGAREWERWYRVFAYSPKRALKK